MDQHDATILAQTIRDERPRYDAWPLRLYTLPTARGPDPGYCVIMRDPWGRAWEFFEPTDYRMIFPLQPVKGAAV